MSTRLKWLLYNSSSGLTIWASAAAFLSYFGMYMYRKPFTAGTYEAYIGYGIDYKSLLVISQVIGYAISKFIGIGIISQMQQKQRRMYYVSCILISELFLVLFSLFPFPYGWFFLALSALPLGLIWGIVFQYLEGRRITEVLTVMLSANFILASGIAKSVGNWFVMQGISETSMPALVGLLSVPLCLITIWMLEQLPQPTEQDIAMRVNRPRMDKSVRAAVWKNYGWLIILFAIMYILLTAIRDIRDNFGVEIWNALGYPKATELYTLSEFAVTLFVLVCLGILYKIANNFRALQVQLLMIFSGIFGLIGVTICFLWNIVPPIPWMMISGVGLFIPYILFNGMLFDRLIAAFRMTANVGFFMYIVDTAGYAFSVVIIIWKSQFSKSYSWLEFYTVLCIAGGILLFIAIIPVWIEIQKKERIFRIHSSSNGIS